MSLLACEQTLLFAGERQNDWWLHRSLERSQLSQLATRNGKLASRVGHEKLPNQIHDGKW